MKIIINTGDKFNMLTVIKELPKIKLPCGQYNRYFLCKCDCGKESKVRLVHLIRGRIKSCGCLSGEKSNESGKTELYRKWASIKYRCQDGHSKSNLYFINNRTVCKEWRESYLKFKEWALNNGFEPGLQIDRIDNKQGYNPSNCRFVSSLINTNNRDNTFYVIYKNEKYPFMLLVRKMGLIDHYATIKGRILRGWSCDKAIDTPIKKGNYYNKGYKYEYK